MRDRYDIRQARFHKGNVFLLSVIGDNAYWSTHPWTGRVDTPLVMLSATLWDKHAQQVNDMIREAKTKSSTPRKIIEN